MINRFEKNRRKIILKWLVNGKVLDMGSTGHGDYEPTLHQFLKDNVDGNVIGLDIKKDENVDIVLDLNKKKYPIKSKSYDTIIAGDIIEHLDCPLIFLKECKRILKPNGRIILTTPNMNSITYILGIVNTTDRKFILHSHAWNMGLFDELVHRAGFKTIHKELFNSLASWDYILDLLTNIFPVFKTELFYVWEKGDEPSQSEVVLKGLKR